MKFKTRPLFPLFVLMLFSSAGLFAQKAKQLSVSNPSDFCRPDELIVLSRKMIERKLGKIPEGNYISIIESANRPVVVQFDDMDKDEKWDEAAFLYSFKPGEKVVFNVSVTGRLLGKAVVRAHVRQRRKNTDATFGPALERDSVPAGQPNTDFSQQKLPPFLTEGPAWENDKVGFRIYFDVRNTKDIWGKTTSKMMLDTVGADPSDSYHHLAGWGMDILAVGKSLGAGSLAMSMPLTGKKDTLIRLGGQNMGPVIYEKIADGPVRAIFRLHYPDWKALESIPALDLTEEISIWGGQYFYESKVSVYNAPAGARLVSGIVNLNSKKSTPVARGGVQGLFTYDLQSENKDHLGMAILTPASLCDGTGTTPNEGTDVKNTYYVSMKISPGRTSDFRFYSGWEKSDKIFSAEKGFRDYIGNEAVRYGQPLNIIW
ncbi:DUF4861 domain-containing protein [Arcticibacter tournemirensis]|nr:DUF4861 domain-containing protein [Arcticibacter tournemirensis]